MSDRTRLHKRVRRQDLERAAPFVNEREALMRATTVAPSPSAIVPATATGGPLPPADGAPPPPPPID